MDKKKILEKSQGYLMMVLGCLVYALGVNLFIKPCEIVAGGVSGLATLVYVLTKGQAPIGLLIILLNIPIFLLGLKYSGKEFILKALLTVAVLGGVTDLFAFLPAMTDDPLMAALYGGICQGVGIGLFVRFEFSSGGTELLGRVISKWVKVSNIPVCVGICDALIVLSGAFFVGASNVLYALIVVFVSTKLCEMILVGLEKSKLCIIISKKGREISQTLLQQSPRGVTLLDGQGMYTQEQRDVLLTCVKNRQLSQLRAIVRSIDENAFVIINDSVEVRGKGFSKWDE